MKKSKLLLILTMLIFGSIGLFVREIQLSSSQIALVRGIIGSLFLAVASVVMNKKLSWKAIKPNFILLLLSGAAIGFNWICLFQAYHYTTISNATLTYYLAPVIVMFLSPIILKEDLPIMKILCIIGALTGMALIAGISKSSGSNSIIGIGYGMLAALLYASVIIANKFLKGLTGLETTITQLATASLVLLPYVLITDNFHKKPDGMSLLILLTLGILHTGIAYLLYFTLIQKMNVQTVAVFSYMDPISAIVMSSIFLNEKMSFLQIAGGILILGSTFVSENYQKINSGRIKRN